MRKSFLPLMGIVLLFSIACSNDDDVIDGENQEQGSMKVKNNGHDYNPTSSKTATASGSLITANISGLKAGTTYDVKCTATGKGGTTTTTTTRCITNY